MMVFSYQHKGWKHINCKTIWWQKFTEVKKWDRNNDKSNIFVRTRDKIHLGMLIEINMPKIRRVCVCEFVYVRTNLKELQFHFWIYKRDTFFFPFNSVTLIITFDRFPFSHWRRAISFWETFFQTFYFPAPRFSVFRM